VQTSGVDPANMEDWQVFGEDNPQGPGPDWVRAVPRISAMGGAGGGPALAGEALQCAHTLVLSAADAGQE